MDQSSPIFMSSVGVIVVDNAVFHLSMSLSVLEIFAIKLWNCAKSRQILDHFCLPKF